MLKKLKKENMGSSNLGWLESRFHFSFAEYRNPKNINFSVLRVLNADIKIYQDINIYVSELEIDKSLEFEIKENRQVYFVQIEGISSINGLILENGDAMEIVDEKKIEIKALENSHFLFIEMAKV